MWFLAIPVYYFVTRAFMVFYWSLTWPGYSLSQFHQLFEDSNPRVLERDLPGAAFIPIFGDFILFCILFKIAFWYPMFWFQNLGYFFRNWANERKEIKTRRKTYLDGLAKYGLSPKDIPAYIRSPHNLDEFLSVWKKHGILK